MRDVDLDAYNRWNVIVGNIKKDVADIGTDAIINSLKEKVSDPEKVGSIIKATILGFGLELEYREFHDMNFFDSAFSFLEDGNLPCGYRGSYPDGQFIVF